MPGHLGGPLRLHRAPDADPDAFNYDEDATIPAFVVQSDGTAADACEYGCTTYYACNYDAAATVNDGSCDSSLALGVKSRVHATTTRVPRFLETAPSQPTGTIAKEIARLTSTWTACATPLKWKDATTRTP